MRIILTCSVCGKSFEAIPYRVKTTKHLACSYACAAVLRRKPPAPFICAWCGTTFERRSPTTTTRFCSRACAHAGKVKRRPAVCRTCGKVYSRPPSSPGPYCSTACKYDSAPEEPILFGIWFWGNVAVSDDTAVCWDYTRQRTSTGYGLVPLRGRKLPKLAHRIAYELVKGPIGDGLVIRHLCNHPPCCNPYHLEAGTQFDNAVDRMHHRPVGTLNPEQVREIRTRAAAGETGKALAAAFGVWPGTIRNILKGRTWGWLED